MKQDEAELGQTAVMERDGAATSSVARSQTQRERCAEAARNRGPKTDSGFISLSERFKELRQRLIDKGYDPDEPPPPPVYICSHCHDLGFVYPVDANGNTDYSRVKPCPSALCVRARLDKCQLSTNRRCRDFC